MKRKSPKKHSFTKRFTYIYRHIPRLFKAIIATISLGSILLFALSNSNLQTKSKNPTPVETDSLSIGKQIPNTKLVTFEKLPLLSEVKPSEVLQVAIKREEVLKEEIKTDPKSFLEHATLTDKQQQLPQEVQKHVEKKIETEGTLTVIHGDDIKNEKTTYIYRLAAAGNNTPYTLYFVKNPPELLTGSVVKIKGIGIGNAIAMESGQDDPNATYQLHTVSAATVYATGEQKTAVILINFQNDTSQPVSKSQIEKLLFSKNDRSVSKYYMENSFGKTYFTGTVFDWITVPYSNSTCDDYDWTTYAENTLKNQNVDLTSYPRIVYIFANTYTCGSGGYGTIGGKPSRAWILSSQDDIRIYDHELGHNLGLHHANEMICEDGAVNTNNKCTSHEYDDVYDVMGNFWYVGNNAHYFNVPHRIGLGWIEQEKVRPVSASGTYNVYVSESPSVPVKALRIPRQKTNDYFYLSYRQPVGFDANLPKEMTSGASIHVWNDINYEQTQAIDIDQTDKSWQQKALVDNQTFYDQINNITIKQLSHNSVSAQLQITIGTPISQTTFIKPWYDTSTLASSVISSKSVAVGNHIVTIGGYEERKSYYEDPSLSQKVQTAAILGSSGATDTWKLTTPLPKPVTDTAITVSGDYIYVVGGSGIDNTSPESKGYATYPTATVYFGKVNTDGTITSWNTTTNLPFTVSNNTAIAVNNYLYVLGGFRSDNDTKSIYYAPIQSDGTLGNWQKTTDFLYNTWYNGSVVSANGYLYSAGGYSYDDGFNDKILYNAKIQADGTLGNWQKLDKSAQEAYDGTLLAFGKYVLYIGGYDRGERKEIRYAVSQNDGSISDWIQDSSLPELVSNFSAVIKDSYVYIIGGYTATGIQHAILSAQFSPAIGKNVPPAGAFEGITDLGYITGWAADPNTPSDALTIHVYVDPPSKGNSFPGNTTIVSQSATTAGFATGNHGFSIRIPDIYRDGKEHTYAVYALDTQQGRNSLLTGSTKKFTINGHVMPNGVIDAYTSDDYLVGWAIDPNIASASATVFFHVDNSKNPSFSVTTDSMRTDVNKRFNAIGNHGFRIKLPSQYKDNKPHTINAYVANMYGEKKLLGNSPINTFTPKANPPLGKLETITANGLATGWAFDPDTKDTPVTIWLTIDSTSLYYSDTQGKTDITRKDINAAKNLTGTHGFSIAIPDYYNDGREHKLYAYALDDITQTIYPLTDSGMTFTHIPSNPVINTVTIAPCGSTSCGTITTVIITGSNFGDTIKAEAIGLTDGKEYSNGYALIVGRTGNTQLIVDFHGLPCNQQYAVKLFYPAPDTRSAQAGNFAPHNACDSSK